MLLFSQTTSAYPHSCRFAVSLFQRITSLMFTPWRLAMLESDRLCAHDAIMLSLLFCQSLRATATNRQTLAGFSRSAQFVPLLQNLWCLRRDVKRYLKACRQAYGVNTAVKRIVGSQRRLYAAQFRLKPEIPRVDLHASLAPSRTADHLRPAWSLSRLR